MSKPRVFVTRIILESGLKLVLDFCQAEVWLEEIPPSREEILAHVRNLDGLLCLLTDQIDAEIMEAAGPQLKIISNHAVGVDNIDVEAATRRGIPVGNTPGILTDATADMAFALLLAAARRVVEGDRVVKAGGWKTWGPGFLLGADLNGATLGIVGFGRIGRALAQRASGFGMHILFTDPSTVLPEPGVIAEQVDLNTLLRKSDFISLHTPLTEQTRSLINANTLKLMKPTAVLINTSRGPVVDQEALFNALSEKRIFAAALDVTVPEPLPPNHPLLGLDNCIVVPHIASASWRTRERMSAMAAENLIAGLKGDRLPNCVNPEVYDNPRLNAKKQNH
jgi:lactate dehydrogenase-like 2-hydroxyacid dehydrogenase